LYCSHALIYILYKDEASENLHIFPVSIILFHFMTVKKVCLFRFHLVNSLAHHFLLLVTKIEKYDFAMPASGVDSVCC